MQKIAETTGLFGVPVVVTKDDNGYWIHIHYGDEGAFDQTTHIKTAAFIEFIKEIVRKEGIEI